MQPTGRERKAAKTKAEHERRPKITEPGADDDEPPPQSPPEDGTPEDGTPEPTPPHVVLERWKGVLGDVLVEIPAGREFTDPVQIAKLIAHGVALAPASRMTGHVHCPECGNIFRPEEGIIRLPAPANRVRPAIVG